MFTEVRELKGNTAFFNVIGHGEHYLAGEFGNIKDAERPKTGRDKNFSPMSDTGQSLTPYQLKSAGNVEVRGTPGSGSGLDQLQWSCLYAGPPLNVLGSLSG